ncbi:hypothetical protein [Streptomyces sp. NPDC048606]|uniref:hypothetical protein n=1 Tax=Streptomyces sp. NPDC048606 TaxID=3154726 RepID=UPI0034317BC7
MRLKSAATAIAVACLSSVPVVVAAPASAAPSGPTACSTYSNYVSYGASCDGTRGYYAWAVCQNNKIVNGPVRSGGTWSYAYCSNVGSTLRSGGYTLV